MSPPLIDASTHPFHTFQNLTPRQQAEQILDKALPPAGPAVTGTSSHASTFDPDDLLEPLQRINDVMKSYGVKFELSEVASRVVTKIVDRANGDVIRQIPTEEVIKIAERLDSAQGRLFSEEA